MAFTPRVTYGASINYADVVAPSYVSSSIPSAGTTIVDTYNETLSVTITTTTGRAITMSGGAVTLSSPVASGATVTWTLSRVVSTGETCSANAYTAPGTGIVDLWGNYAATYTGLQANVTNSSTAGAAGLAPDAITGLAAWYKTPISGGTDNTNQGTWPNSVAGGLYDMTRASDMPKYQTAEVNGYAAMEFDGLTQGLTDNGYPNSSYNRTLFAVVKRSSVLAVEKSTILGSDVFGALNIAVEHSSLLLTIRKQGISTIGTSTGTVSNNAWHVIVVRTTTTTWAIYIDGTLDSSGTHSEAIDAGRSFQIGYAFNTERWAGLIAECGIYSSDIGSSAALDLGTHLKAKYAI